MKKIPAAFRWSLSAWILARLILTAWGVVVQRMGLLVTKAEVEASYGIIPLHTGVQGALLGVWQRWDAIHYIRIAQSGYSSTELTVFFPLYPLLGALIKPTVGGNTLLALVILSNLSFLFALVFLYRFTEDQFGIQAARGAVVATVVSPMSFFFFAPYPLALALLLVLVAFWAARQQKWEFAAAAGLLAGLTHSTILPMSFGLAWEAVCELRKQGWAGIKALLAPASPVAGVAVFLAWRQAVGYAPFTSVQDGYWGRILQWPWQNLYDFYLQRILHPLSIYGWIQLSLEMLGIMVLVIGLTLWSARKLGMTLLVYQVSLLAYLFCVTLRKEVWSGWGRYSLMMFPVMIAAGLWAKSPRRRKAALAVSIALQLFLSAEYFSWIWLG